MKKVFLVLSVIFATTSCSTDPREELIISNEENFFGTQLDMDTKVLEIVDLDPITEGDLYNELNEDVIAVVSRANRLLHGTDTADYATSDIESLSQLEEFSIKVNNLIGVTSDWSTEYKFKEYLSATIDMIKDLKASIIARDIFNKDSEVIVNQVAQVSLESVNPLLRTKQTRIDTILFNKDWTKIVK